MRRKQLYAIILAGALAASSAPAAVFAAEGDVAATAETSEENPVDGETAAATEAPAEQAPAEQAPADTTAATEAPAEQAPAQEAAAATEAPAQEAAPAEQTQQTTEETPATQETPAAETTEAPEAGETASGVMITVDGVTTAYKDIQDAINNAPAPTTDENGKVQIPVIEVTKDQSISTSITVESGKRVCITATAAVNITRADGFTDEIFKVYGNDSELALDVEGESASLSLDGTATNTTKTLVSVSDSGAFEVYNGVVLTNNKTDDNGGAITNDGGKLYLVGGTVTGNSGAKGGIYSNTTVCIGVSYSTGAKSDIKVADNKNGQDATVNLYVELSDASEVPVKITGALADTASIGYTDASPATDKKIITIGKDTSDNSLVSADEFKTAVSKFTYDDSEKFVFAELTDGADTVTLKAVDSKPDPEPGPAAFVIKETGSVSWSDYTTATAYFNTTNDCKWYYERVKEDATVSTVGFNESKAINSASAGDVPVNVKNIPTGNWAIAVYAKSQTDGTVQALKIVLNNRKPTTFKISQASNTKVEWEDYNTATVYFTATHDCKWYSQVKKASTKKFSLADSKAVNTAKAGDVVSAVVKDIPEGEGYAIVVLARSTQDNAPAVGIFSLDYKNRPAKSSTATRKAKTYSVTDNKVTGLENPLKFFPSKKYEFTVTEAGMSDEAPYVVGDERYAFLYWSTSSSGKNPQAKKVIMSSKGIQDANTYTMYLFFQKYRFNGTDWVKKGSPESISTKFSSAGYTDEELKEYLEEAKENGTEVPGYENDTGSGDDADAELTATAAASEKDAGSKSKSAVSTADESPIGTMSALAALSLLAGGYIVVRKRKKEEL